MAAVTLSLHTFSAFIKQTFSEQIKVCDRDINIPSLCSPRSHGLVGETDKKRKANTSLKKL